MILVVRTDSMQASIVVYLPDSTELASDTWEAGRNLSRDLLARIQVLLDASGGDWTRLTGIVAYRGPGSFTSLRIGITTVNSIAYARRIPVVGALGADWVQIGLSRLAQGDDDRLVLPEYGAEPHITQSKK